MQHPLITCGLIGLFLLTGGVSAASPDQKANVTQDDLIKIPNGTPVNVYLIIPPSGGMGMGKGSHSNHFHDDKEFSQNGTKSMNRDWSDDTNITNGSPVHRFGNTETGALNSTIPKNTREDYSNPSGFGNMTSSRMKSNLSATT